MLQFWDWFGPKKYAADCKIFIWGVLILLDTLYICIFHFYLSICLCLERSALTALISLHRNWAGVLGEAYQGMGLEVWSGTRHQHEGCWRGQGNKQVPGPPRLWAGTEMHWVTGLYLEKRLLQKKPQLQNQSTLHSLFHPFRFQTKEQSCWCLQTDQRRAERKEPPWF